MTRPTVRHVTWQNDCWTVGAEVRRPNPWPRRIANAIALAAIAALLSYGAYHAVWVAATLRHL